MSKLRVKISLDKVCHPDLYRNIVRNSFKFVSYEECRQWARKNKIKSQKEYMKIKKVGNIPGDPYKTYKNKGWKTWSYFLGTKNYKKINHISFYQCKKWIRKNNVKSSIEYFKLRTEGIPSNPQSVYKNSGWTNWYDFLGKKK